MSTITTHPTVEAAKAEFLRAKDRLAKALADTPDDKINWSPSATSRTPIEQVAHGALAIRGMQGWFAGEPFPFKSMEELDDYSRNQEKEFKTRDQANAALEEHTKGYFAWLDTLTPEQIGSDFETGFGTFPMADAITWPADHLRGHAAQLDYIQTVYGDRSFHM